MVGKWVDLCPWSCRRITHSVLSINFDTAERKVRTPSRLNRRKSAHRELVTQARLESPVADGHTGPAHVHVDSLADTGSATEAVAGRDCLPAHLIVDAPPPLQVTCADKSVISCGHQGVWGTVLIRVQGTKGPRVFRCKEVFVYILIIATKLILGYSFLMRYKLALFPGLPYPVPIEAIKVRPLSGVSMCMQAHCPACHPDQKCAFDAWRATCFLYVLFVVINRESAYLLSMVIARYCRASWIFSLGIDMIVKRMLIVNHTSKTVSPSTAGLWNTFGVQHLGV